MKARIFIALPVGVLLIAAEFGAMYYDARHGVALYRADAVTALPAHR